MRLRRRFVNAALSLLFLADRAVGLLKNMHQLLVERKNIALAAPLGEVAAAVNGSRRRLPQGACKVHMLLYLVPLDRMTGAVGAKHGVARIEHIGVGVVGDRRDDLLRVVARLVALERERKPALSVGVLQQLLGVAAHFGNRRGAGEHAGVGALLRRLKAAVKPLNIVHGSAEIFRRHLQHKIIDRLQQDALGTAQALPHGAVGRLPKVAALGVLGVRLAGNERDLHIGYRRAGEHAEVCFFIQMGQNQPLPVFVEQVLLAARVEHQAAVALGRL